MRARIPELLQINFETVGETRKRVCRLKTQGLDDLLIEWIKKARAYNCIITGPIIQEVATKLATQHLDIQQFKASNGWLEMFRSRNEIVYKVLQGERASAPVRTAEEFKENLPELLAQFDPSNIFNDDEVGLFYEQTGRRTLLMAHEDPAGCKVSKKRLTIFIVAAMDGHLEQMFLINNSLKPRAFKPIQFNSSRLPSCIKWTSSKKGWMNSGIFRDWIFQFNSKMEREGRYIYCYFWITSLYISVL